MSTTFPIVYGITVDIIESIITSKNKSSNLLIFFKVHKNSFKRFLKSLGFSFSLIY